MVVRAVRKNAIAAGGESGDTKTSIGEKRSTHGRMRAVRAGLAPGGSAYGG